jgi:hypothetical protein
MFVIAAFAQTVCVVVAAADVNVIVAFGFTVIVPVAEVCVQDPVVFTVYVNVPVAVGLPLIVIVLPEKEPETPEGNPETVAPVAPPPTV